MTCSNDAWVQHTPDEERFLTKPPNGHAGMFKAVFTSVYELLEQVAIACMVGADLCVCPGDFAKIPPGPHTQVCPYPDLQTDQERGDQERGDQLPDAEALAGSASTLNAVLIFSQWM